MRISRREFLLFAALGLPLGCSATREVPQPLPQPPHVPPTLPPFESGDIQQGKSSGALIKPRRLFEGAAIGLVSPGGVITNPADVFQVEETLRTFGFRTVRGRHVLDRRGYLAGTDEDRAADLHRMFTDPDVDAILTMRGGWGCNRILPLLDYDLIRAHPKILMGFSDITSLLIALYAQAGSVSVHGPVGILTWNDFTVEYVRRVLIDGERATLRNLRRVGPRGPIGESRVVAIRRGRTRGRLVGGNLSVLVSMIGSSFLPRWEGHILFLEDTREDVYRIDRMLTQLSLAGILPQLAGVVFGKCTRCDADEPSLSLHEVLHDHLYPLNIPCFYGSMIGHIADKFTVPVGVEAEMDAAAGTIRLLEPAVI